MLRLYAQGKVESRDRNTNRIAKRRSEIKDHRAAGKEPHLKQLRRYFFVDESRYYGHFPRIMSATLFCFGATLVI